MSKKLHFALLVLMMLIVGRSAHAQSNNPDVNTLGEAIALGQSCDLVLNENSNYTLQAIYVDPTYGDMWLWDGTNGIFLSEAKTYFPDIATGKVIKSGVIHLNYISFLKAWGIWKTGSHTYEDREGFIDAKEVTDPANITPFEFVKIKGTLNADGTQLTCENGTLELSDGYGFTPNLSANGGKTGYVTGTKNLQGKFIVYPEAYFTGENTDDPNRIDTFEKLKAITGNGSVTFYVPNGTTMLALKQSQWDKTMYLWDGKDGVRITGDDVYNKILDGGNITIEPGQSVTGDLSIMFFAENYYFYYNTAYYGTDVCNLTFGEKQTQTPLQLTIADLLADANTKKYNDAYVRVYGTIIPDRRLVSDDGKILKLDDYFELGINFNELVGYKGYVTAIAKKDAFDMSFTLLPITTNFFENQGMAEAEEVVYDALGEVSITKEIPIANVTINNMNLKAGKYSTICLPFDLSQEKVATIFGEGTKLYAPQNYNCSAEADTIFLNSSDMIRAGGKYVIKPMKDLTELKFERINVKSSAFPYSNKVWPKNWSAAITKDINYHGRFSAYDADTIPTTYTITEEGNIAAGSGVQRGFCTYFTIKEGSTKSVLLYDGKEPEVEVVDPNAINTFAKLKAIMTDDMVTFHIPKNTRVSMVVKGDDVMSSYLYLWDGKDGLCITGGDVKESILKNGELNVEVGQLVSGTITAKYFGEKGGYMYYKKAYYPESQDNITFGEKGEVVPLEITGEELQSKVNDKTYNDAYIRIHGVFDPNKNFVCDNGTTIQVDDIFNVKFKIDDAVGHKGYFTVLTNRAAWAEVPTFKFYPVSDTCFADEGIAQAETVVYDANAANTIDKDIPFANVTIKNLNLQKGILTPICLPFDLKKEDVEKVFGKGTVIYAPNLYSSSEKADTVFFYKGESITSGSPYVINSANTVNELVVENASVKKQEPYKVGLWKAETGDVEKVIEIMGTYSPVDLSKVNNSYLFDTEGLLHASTEVNQPAFITKAFSAYVVAEDGLKNIVVVYDEKIVSGISEVTTVDNITNGRIYTINGQYMGTSLNGLKKGVYIRDGKKVVVK